MDILLVDHHALVRVSIDLFRWLHDAPFADKR
jgi:hypothetical protein